jgi:hypothetical protein
MCCVGGSVLEIIGSARSWRGERDGRIVCREKKAGGERTEASQMVKGEGYECNVVGIERFDDGFG